MNISRSGYCAWKKRKDDKEKKEKTYADEIKKIFDESNGTYGPDRVCGELRKRGITASYKRVRTIMENLGLRSIHCQRRQRSLTDSRKARGDDYENLVKDLEITEHSRFGKSSAELCLRTRCQITWKQNSLLKRSN